MTYNTIDSDYGTNFSTGSRGNISPERRQEQQQQQQQRLYMHEEQPYYANERAMSRQSIRNDSRPTEKVSSIVFWIWRARLSFAWPVEATKNELVTSSVEVQRARRVRISK
jgi:hypothetical protein